jgi:hypothetical protein
LFAALRLESRINSGRKCLIWQAVNAGLCILNIRWSLFQMSGKEVPRHDLTEAIRQALRQNPVTALIGPRQCSKTTLARQLAAQEPHEYFDL